MSLSPEPRPNTSLLRRFEAEVLRSYRGVIALGLLGLLLPSVLPLPVPLFQAWLVDRLVDYYQASASGSSAVAAMDLALSAADRAIVLFLVATIGLHAVRTLLAWRVAAMMGRISQEVVVALRGALHRKLMRLAMAYFDAQ
jgi:ABC-type multidrug transport system fused ATPase/permease subunit